MLKELQQAVNEYQKRWQELIETRADKAFFEVQQPTSLGWKVADMAEFDRVLLKLRAHADQIHFGWVNKRWLVTLCLKDLQLPWDLSVVKLMQRRPGSTDALGLDHIDFYSPLNGETKERLRHEPELHWTEENNGAHCKWISVWFANTEAKLRTDTVLQVCADELLDIQQTILKKPNQP